MLDLVHPIGPERRLGSEGGNAGLDKARGKDASSFHPIGIEACCETPQPSSCRGVARIALSETPKMSSTAKLMTPMTARGMFSRHRNNSPSHQSNTPMLMQTLETRFRFDGSRK